MEKDIRSLHPELNSEIKSFLVPMTEADGSIIYSSEKEPILYAPVEAQIYFFKTVYKEGRIVTEHIRRDDGVVEFKASVYKGTSTDEQPLAVAHAETMRSDDIYTSFESTETKALSRALLFAGFGVEAKLLAKLQEKTAKAHSGRIPQEWRENEKGLKESEGLGKSSPSQLSIIESPAENIEQLEVLDGDDPFAANGIVPKAEIMKKEEPPAKIKQTCKNSRSQKQVEKQSDEDKDEPAAPKQDEEGKDKGAKPEESMQDSGSVECQSESEEHDEDVYSDEMENSMAGEYVLVAEDVKNSTELEVFLGKKVKEIDKANLSIIKKYLEGEVSEQLYRAVSSYLE